MKAVIWLSVYVKTEGHSEVGYRGSEGGVSPPELQALLHTTLQRVDPRGGHSASDRLAQQLLTILSRTIFSLYYGN